MPGFELKFERQIFSNNKLTTYIFSNIQNINLNFQLLRSNNPSPTFSRGKKKNLIFHSQRLTSFNMEINVHNI